MKKTSNTIPNKMTDDQTIAELKDRPLSELNSFLLTLLKDKAHKRTAAQVLNQFKKGRFVHPSDIDPIVLRETELHWLKMAKDAEFEPLELSPLTPIGTCSALGHVDQNNVVSAIRGTEVVSDATNVLALQLVLDFNGKRNRGTVLKYSTVHRHVRGQAFDNPNFSTHFSTFCLASGGYDTGNFAFELDQLHDHMSLIYKILKIHFDDYQMMLRFYMKKSSDAFREKLAKVHDKIWSDMDYELIDDLNHEYYQLVQFKIFVKKDAMEYNLADGGFVDWTQKLLSNQKHRCMISGIGVELLHRI